MSHRNATNSHSASNDFFTIVPTTLANLPILKKDDFDQFSSVDNPVELANRVDLSSEFEVYDRAVFRLNFNGLANINKSGYSGFGVREGYDLFTTPNNGAYTNIKVGIFSGYAFFSCHLSFEV